MVDSQLACMMNENSIDYIARFNDLAQELSIPEPTRREILFDGGAGGPPVGDLSQWVYETSRLVWTVQLKLELAVLAHGKGQL